MSAAVVTPAHVTCHTHRSYYLIEGISEKAVRTELAEHVAAGEVVHLHKHRRGERCDGDEGGCETHVPQPPEQRRGVMDLGWLSLPGAW